MKRYLIIVNLLKFAGPVNNLNVHNMIVSGIVSINDPTDSEKIITQEIANLHKRCQGYLLASHSVTEL